MLRRDKPMPASGSRSSYPITKGAR